MLFRFLTFLGGVCAKATLHSMERIINDNTGSDYDSLQSPTGITK